LIPMTHLLLILSAIVLVVASLPLVLELLMVTAASLLPSRIPPSAAASAGPGARPVPKLAIIVPAHNEELLVARSVSSLRAAAHPGVRIYVVAHNCSDATAARAEAAGAEALVYNDPAARGKGFALRYGFRHALSAGAEAVMVVDADSIVSANTITAVEQAFAAGARVVQCRYEMFSTTDKSSTRLSALSPFAASTSSVPSDVSGSVSPLESSATASPSCARSLKPFPTTPSPSLRILSTTCIWSWPENASAI
jgi:cellulose synthase/poly-beta-1,6-N-acetylglucosamine synthase-like glycosyltransferase